HPGGWVNEAADANVPFQRRPPPRPPRPPRPLPGMRHAEKVAAHLSGTDWTPVVEEGLRAEVVRDDDGVHAPEQGTGQRVAGVPGGHGADIETGRRETG